MDIEHACESHGFLNHLNAVDNIAKDCFVCSPGVVKTWSVYENVEFALDCGMTELVFLSDFKTNKQLASLNAFSRSKCGRMIPESMPSPEYPFLPVKASNKLDFPDRKSPTIKKIFVLRLAIQLANYY